MDVAMQMFAAMPPPDQYLDVKGVTTRYWKAGGDGSPVVLVHGLGRYAEDWLPTVQALADGHQVYALDLIGHGRTAKPQSASYDLDALARFVRDFMASAGIEHAHVVGHSLGGAIATRLALTCPEAVDRLVLVAPAGLSRDVHTIFRLMRQPIIGELVTRPSRSGSARVLKLCLYDGALVTDQAIELNYQMSRLPGAQKALLKTVRDCWKGMPRNDKSAGGPELHGLASFPISVLVVWGRQDSLLPVAHADIAAKELPQATIKLIDCCGHAPMFDQPQEFTALLVDFLRD